MSEQDEALPLRQMLDYAVEAIELTTGRSRADFDEDRLLNLGITRLVEIIGEASNRVPADLQEQLPGIPWTQIRGTRNRLIHAYDFVDYDVVWQTVVEDLPPLVIALRRHLGE